MLESTFRDTFLTTLKDLFPGCIVLKNDASYLQGIPDYIMLWEDRWAMFELKRNKKASRRPNQVWYVDKLDNMSFAAFVYPENMNEVLDDLQRAFRA